MDFWERLKNEIKRQNTTQEWVAGKINVSYRTFNGWISRKIMPNADQAVSIAKLLDTTVEYLITGKAPEAWHPPRRYADIIENLELLDDDGLEYVRSLVQSKVRRIKKKGKSTA